MGGAPLWLLLASRDDCRQGFGGIGDAGWWSWSIIRASGSHLGPFGGYGEFGGPEADAGSRQ